MFNSSTLGRFSLFQELVNAGKKKSKSKLRRRKPLQEDSEEESDGSDNDNLSDYSSSDDSFISDTEDVLVDSSDEELDITKPNDTIPKTINGVKPDVAKPTETKDNTSLLRKVQKMDPAVMLEIVNEEGLLQSIRVVNDWLKCDPEIIKSCASNTRTLIRQIVRLVNLININLKDVSTKLKISEVINQESKIPLAEDVILKGVPSFQTLHANYDWEYLLNKDVTAKEEAVIRIIKILSFGKWLSKIDEAKVTYDERTNVFQCQLEEKSEEDEGLSAAALMEKLERQEVETTPSKTSLTNGESREEGGGHISNTKMKHMGQLWLAAEVRALEKSVGGTKATLSPYLVLDADALIKYTHMVKQLVYSRQFILIVPAAGKFVADFISLNLTLNA